MANTHRILVVCPGCSHEFRLSMNVIGRKVPCPHCSLNITAQGESGTSSDQLLGKKIGGVRLVKRLGAGAIGLVYQGRDLESGQAMAIKMIGPKAAANPDTVKRFMREARLCAQIDHPNVVKVFDCGFDRGVNYLIMEYVENGTLAEILEERGALPWQETFAYVYDIANALVKAGELNIVHRDIKPANILITTDGQAKLADLGLAKQVDADAPGNELTMQGTAIGSPTYMSPEQATNAKDARAPADIYGLGATWYHAISGQRPFIGASTQMVLIKVLREAPIPLREINPQIPTGIADLIARMMDRDWKKRPQSAKELITLLDAVQANPNQAPRTTKTIRVNKDEQTSTAAFVIPNWGFPALLAGIAVIIIVLTLWIVFR